MNCEQVKSKLGSIAESVRANVLYDMKFELSPLDFFQLKMKNEQHEEKTLSNAIYKYNKNGS